MSEGDAILKKAQNKISKFQFIYLLVNDDAKYEDAAELYISAATSFKNEKRTLDSALAFEKSAECFFKIKQYYEGCNALQNAINCFKIVCNSKKAIQCYKQVIEIYRNTGKFQLAAKNQEELAKYYESIINTTDITSCSDVITDVDIIVYTYKEAADLYRGENMTIGESNCCLKIAHYLSLQGKYNEAIKYYIDEAKKSIESNILKFKVKEFLLKAGICFACLDDTIGFEKALASFLDIDVTFESSREYEFLTLVLTCMKENDVELFETSIQEYEKNTFSKIDAYKITLLLVVKNLILTNRLENGSIL